MDKREVNHIWREANNDMIKMYDLIEKFMDRGSYYEASKISEALNMGMSRCDKEGKYQPFEINDNSKIQIQMPEKEIREARQARIPEEIIAKISQGLELSEREKKMVRDHGKVYVPAHKKNGVVTVRPQLRTLPYKRGKSPKYLK